MSEVLEAAVETESPTSEAEFEAARVAEEADDAGGFEEQLGEGAEPTAERAIDWEKRAHDKEGLAAKERARRRESERQVRELNERITRMEAATARPAAGEQSLEDMIAALPDPEEDPIGATAAMTKIIQAFGKQQTADTEAETRQQTTQRELSTLAARMSEAETDFADDHPDYKEAMEHFKQARQADFEDMGYSGQDLQRAMADDLFGLVRRSLSGGKDPAEVVYNLAKKRGFASGKAVQDAKLREIAAAAQAGARPEGARHGTTSLTYESVGKLKGAAFDSAWAKLRAQEKAAGR